MRRAWRSPFRTGLALILVVVLLIACGGGGGNVTAASGGAGGTGISAGMVSAIGSITVNDRRFDTGNAEIFVEGQRAGVGDQAVFANLAVGMVVRVEGDIKNARNGTAQRVYFNDDIRGPVASIRQIDATTAEWTVLGKTIVVQEDTQTAGLDLNSLRPGDWVQVSGFPAPEGRLFATFLTTSIPATKANLKGAVSQLDEAGEEFEIDGVTIAFQNADLIAIGQLSDGLHVEVTGDIDLANRLVAERIELIVLFGTDDADLVELEGIISANLSDTRFVLNGVIVVLVPQTDFERGDASEIQSGARIEVEGRLVGGEIYADKIIFLDDAKAESNVALNDTGQSVLHLAGLPDVTIRYNEITKVNGAVNTTGDITDEHHIKIIGKKTSLDDVVAFHIIVAPNASSRVKLQGRLEGDPGPVITLLSQSINLDDILDENFELSDGTYLGYSGFLATTQAGDMISTLGELNGGEVIWRNLTIE